MSGLRGGALGVDGVSRSDVLVVGSGAAGLTAALGCAPLRVTVLTKARAGHGRLQPLGPGRRRRRRGQGRRAPALHAADTMAAGAGLNDPRVVDLLTAEGPARVKALLALGARSTATPPAPLALGREAAHSRRRILHARDATGAEIVRTLVEAVHHAPEVQVLERRPSPSTWCWKTARWSAWWPSTPTAGACSISRPPWCWPPAAWAGSISTPPIRPRPRATAWPWRRGPAPGWWTWSSSSSTPRRWPPRAPIPCRSSPRPCAARARS